MALSEIQIKKAKASVRPYKFADGEGLFLLVQRNGSKLWRLKYRFRGKEKPLSFGPYPELASRRLANSRSLRRRLWRRARTPWSTNQDVISKKNEPSGPSPQCDKGIARAVLTRLMPPGFGHALSGMSCLSWAR